MACLVTSSQPTHFNWFPKASSCNSCVCGGPFILHPSLPLYTLPFLLGDAIVGLCGGEGEALPIKHFLFGTFLVMFKIYVIFSIIDPFHPTIRLNDVTLAAKRLGTPPPA